MSIESAEAHIERGKTDAGARSQVGAADGGVIVVVIFLIGLLGVIISPVSRDIDKIVAPSSVSHVIDENIEGGP